MIIQRKLVVGKMKDQTAGVAIEEFVGLKTNMYLFLVDTIIWNLKKQQIWIIFHNGYKDVLWNNEYLRYLINKIQNINHTTGTYEIIKIPGWISSSLLELIRKKPLS